MEKEPPRARLFVALDLPDDARAALVEWRLRAFGDPALRLVAPEALHVTLVFLGYVPESDLERVAGALPEGARQPLLQAIGVKPLPPRRPRLVALDLADQGGDAARIQNAVADALRAEGLYEPEARAWWPHVTLARVRKGARLGAGALDAAQSALDARAASGPSIRSPWRPSAITLYRSRLSPKGARYEPLARVALGLQSSC